jgi:hypothetical protein
MIKSLFVVLVLVLLPMVDSVAAEQIGSLEAFRAALDHASRNGQDVRTMDAKITFYRPSHKPPPERASLPSNVTEALKGNNFWRVLFYVDITKSVGLRGRSLCIYVDAKSTKIVGSYDDCPL